jgi:hypothetical protein
MEAFDAPSFAAPLHGNAAAVETLRNEMPESARLRLEIGKQDTLANA